MIRRKALRSSATHEPQSLGGSEERRLTRYRSLADEDEPQLIDHEFEWDDEEAAERRRDPLRH